MPLTKELIQTVTVGAGGAAAIQLTGIPSTFTDLLLIGSLRDAAGAVTNNININFNNDTSTIYSARRLYGTGSGVGFDSFSSLNSAPGTWDTSASATANTFNNFAIYIPNYSGSTNKSFSMDSVSENNATAANQGISAGLWASTAAINRIDLSAAGNNFQQYSTASLYGITKGSSNGVTVA